ncbi:conserved Plasmodium protein, unknown function [Plasmodium malariae]|uniref:GSKIP domain-containing protein n=1 Tax=Plasmodium malariae TaxID=5858 RepID=A0A1D3JMC3_PLAMA|nr:conserved Plasmodium protein, unknown function [Plasmodium malariae]SBT87723.1 conserved Plasmodium protein, unknown function [Plasmodium malariae]
MTYNKVVKMNNNEIKIIEKEYENFYDKFSYINENTFCLNIVINDETEERSRSLRENKILKLIIKFHCGYFEVLNNELKKDDNKTFDNIEQIFNTFCPLSFKKFITQRVRDKLTAS